MSPTVHRGRNSGIDFRHGRGHTGASCSFSDPTCPESSSGVRVVLNISSQLLQFFGAEYRTPMPSRQRGERLLSAFTNPSTNGFNVTARNISKLPPAGSPGLASCYDNRANFRSCYLHERSLTNLYNFRSYNAPGCRADTLHSSLVKCIGFHSYNTI